jgi:transcriptional regulator with XRE-family HTH domain
MEIGTTIKILRTKAGLQQKALAGRTGFSQNYLSLVENNKREPSISFIRSVASALNVPIEFFLWNEFQPPNSIPNEEKAIVDEIRKLFLELQLLRIQRDNKSNEHVG